MYSDEPQPRPAGIYYLFLFFILYLSSRCLIKNIQKISQAKITFLIYLPPLFLDLEPAIQFLHFIGRVKINVWCFYYQISNQLKEP